MPRRLVLLVAVVIVTALCVPALAGAQEIYTLSYSGTSADAYTSTMHEDGADAPYEDRMLWGGFSSSIQAGDAKPQRIRDTMGAFHYLSYEPTTSTQPATLVIFSAFGPADVAIDRALSAAAVDFVTTGEISVWRTEMPWNGGEDEWLLPDETRTLGVTVSGDWASTGPLWRDSFMMRSRTDGFFSIDRSNSSYRNAACDALVVDSDGRVWQDGLFDSAAISNSKGGGHMKGLYPEMP